VAGAEEFELEVGSMSELSEGSDDEDAMKIGGEDEVDLLERPGSREGRAGAAPRQ
jgi:hypothetical protein